MKEQNFVVFNSTLLVPFPKFCQGLNFRWVTTITGKTDTTFEKINVIVFNTEKKEEIKPLLEKDLALLKAFHQDEAIKRQIDFIEKTLGEIGTDYEHMPSQGLLDAVAKGSGKTFSTDEVIYLSGVKYLEDA